DWSSDVCSSDLDGARAFKTTMPWPLRSDYGQPARMPLPWDQVYQGYYKRIMRKLADRYGDNENFVAITLTGANFVYGEIHLPKTDADIQQWEMYGNYQKRIEHVYNNLTDFYAETFPNQQFALHITLPIPGMQKHVKNIIEYGTRKYPERF